MDKHNIAQVIGPYWDRTLKEDVVPFIDTHGLSLSTGKDAIEALYTSFNQQADVPEAIHICAVEVPLYGIYPTPAYGTDADAVYGEGKFKDQRADNTGWIIELKADVIDVSLLSVDIGFNKVYIKGIDFIQRSSKILELYTSPYDAGFKEILKVEDNEPVTYLRFYIKDRLYQGQKEGLDRYSFYGVPDAVRNTVHEMILKEGSTSLLIKGLHDLYSVKSPTTYDKQDEQGRYTVVDKFWRDPVRFYGYTSAKELIWAETDLTPLFDHKTKIYEGQPFIGVFKYAERFTDTDISGLLVFPENTEGIIVLNKEEDLGENIPDSIPGGDPGYKPFYNLQVRGKKEDKDVFYNSLRKGLEEIEIPPEDVFDSTGNPVEQLFDRLGRTQPLAVNMSTPGLIPPEGFFTAYKDNTPAGTGVIFNIALSTIEDITPSFTEVITPFLVYEHTEQVQPTITETFIQGDTVV